MTVNYNQALTAGEQTDLAWQYTTAYSGITLKQVSTSIILLPTTDYALACWNTISPTRITPTQVTTITVTIPTVVDLTLDKYT